MLSLLPRKNLRSDFPVSSCLGADSLETPPHPHWVLGHLSFALITVFDVDIMIRSLHARRSRLSDAEQWEDDSGMDGNKLSLESHRLGH